MLVKQACETEDPCLLSPDLLQVLFWYFKQAILPVLLHMYLKGENTISKVQ